MAATIGQAVIVIGADASGFQDDLHKQTSKASKDAGDKSGNIFSDTLGKALTTGAVVAGAAVTGILGTALVKGFERLTAIDDAKAKLLGLKMPAETVTQVMDNALASVKGTAFGLGEAATLAASAVAAGIKPGEDLTRTLKLMADAAAISGRPLVEMGGIFNKVAASGKVTGEILNQLSDSGIPIIGLLATQLNTTSADVVDLVTKGKVGFADFQAAMEKGLGGAALSSANTFSGAMKNTLAALGRFGEGLLGGVFAQIPGLFKNAITWLDAITPTAKEVGANIGAAFKTAYDSVGAFVGKVVEFAQSPQVSAFMAGVTENVTLVKQYITDFVNDPSVQEFVKNLWDKAIAGIQGLASWIQEDLIPALITVGGWVRDVVNWFRDHENAVKALGVTIGIVSALIVAAWVAQGVVAVQNGIKSVIAWISTATASTTSATIQSKSTAQIVFGWVVAGAAAILHGAKIVATWVWMGIQATVHAAITAGAWLGAWLLMAAQATIHAVAVAAVWIGQWVMQAAAAVVNAAVVVATWVGAWVVMSAQAMIHAVRIAAAWLIAMGPIGIIIAAVIALVAIVIANLDTIKSWISTAWDWITSTTYSVWQSIYSFFENIWNNITSWISNAVNNIKGWIGTAWQWIQDTTAAVWDKIKWFIFGPIGAIVLFVTQNLDTIKATISNAWENIKAWTSNAWNTVTSFISTAWQNIVNAVSEKINAVIEFARGLPGRVVGALGDLARTLWDKGTAIIQGLLDGAMERIRGIGDWASSIKDKIIDAIKAVFGIHSPSTVFAGLGVNMMQGLLQGLLQGPEILRSAVKSIGGTLMDWLGGLGSRVGEFFSGLFGGVGGGGAVGAGVQRWAGVAQAAMQMAGLPLSYLPLLLQRMNVESGGNPMAINLWDSNAKAGIPSMGLMQTIGPTFAAYAGPLASRGVWDPLANIYAAIKYSLARYGLGGIPRAWGGRGGYAAGTPSAIPGWAMVGERGPEWVRFRGGETVLPSGRSPASSITVNLTISVDDLDKMSKIGDFLDMLDRARLDNRRTARSGMVAA